YQPLQEKILNKISGWKGRFLNQAGKTVLIKHVLSSVPIHSLVVTAVLKGTLDTREKEFTDFF
ncbi:hypothetical protein PJI17_32800, partial [Mycobacterium kansasii]